MKRRHFLAGGLTASSALLLPEFSIANNDATTTTRKFSEPWRGGFTGATQAFKTTKLNVEGNWPVDAFGNFYRNGPTRVERNGVHLQHWFDGDGMVNRFAITAKGIFHSGQFVATEKYLREEAEQKYLYNATGTVIPNATSPRNNDTVNVANTALLPWQNELLALWEGGSAYRLNPDTLTTLGEQKWSDELAHVPFSAHPLLEKDGSLWNFGFVPYGKQARLLIYHINTNNQVIGLGNIILPQRGYFHAFAQTTDYLIFYVSACIYEQGETFLKAFHWRPEVGSKILVINKNALDKPRWFDVPAEFVFHFGNAWQDNNSIHVVMARYKDASLMLNAMHKVMIGEQPELEHAQMTIAKINLQTGSVTLNASGINLEFPNYNPDAAGPTTIYGTHATSPERKFFGDSIAAMHPEKGLLAHYCFGANVIAEEPLLIRTSKNNYLIASYYNYDKQHSGVALFDAHNLNNGPIAQATMNYVLPLGFHGCFVTTNV